MGWMIYSTSFSDAAFGNALIYVFSPFIPVFIAHTAFCLLDLKGKAPLITLYASAVVCVILSFTGHLSTVAPALDFRYYTSARAAYPVFVLHLYGAFAWIEYFLWQQMKKSTTSVTRQQIRSLMIGTSIGFIGGQTTVPLVFGVPLFPYGNFAVPLYIACVAHAMLRHQFLDLKLAAKRDRPRKRLQTGKRVQIRSGFCGF
jgi:hypothetical protein